MQSWFRIRSTLLIALLFFAVTATPQGFISQTVFSAADLSRVRLQQLCFDHSGFLWIGTYKGLYRRKGDELLHNSNHPEKQVTAIAAAGSGILTGCADGSVYYSDALSTRAIPMPKAATPAPVISILKKGALTFFGTAGNGIVLITGGKHFTFNTSNGLPDDYVYAMHFTSANTMLIATDRGINEISLAKTAGPEHQTVFSGSIVPCMAADEQGNIFFASEDGIIGCIRPEDNGYHLDTIHTHHSNTAITTDKDGTAWIGQGHGRLIAAGMRAGHISILAADSIDKTAITNIASDAGGIVWTATPTALRCTPGLGMQPLHIDLDLRKISSLAVSKEGIWYNQHEKLYLYTDEGSRLVTTLPQRISTFCAAYAGIYAGTTGAGIFLIDASGRKRQLLPAATLNAKGHILSLAHNRDTLWAATLSGVEELLLRGNETHFNKHYGKAVIGSDYVYDLFHAHDGTLWMATDGAGVAMVSNGQAVRHDNRNGFNAAVAYSITQDKAGNIWAATPDKGAACYRNNTWTFYHTAQGLAEEEINALAATDQGMMIVYPAAVYEWIERSGTFRQHMTGTAVNIDSLSHMLNITATDSTVHVYLPYDKGFLRFTAPDADPDIQPKIQLGALTVEGISELPGRHRFRADERFFTFRFEGQSPAGTDKLHYRYRLLGFNNEWTATADEQATFSRLLPGSYALEVQAAENPAFRNPASVIYKFSVARPWWLQWWAVMGSITLLFAGLYAFVRVRELGIRRRNSLERATLMAQYGQLRSHVAPHFLFNSLNTLLSLIEDDPEAAKLYTTELSALYRGMVSHRSSDIISLEEEWKLVQHFVHIQQVRFGAALHIDTGFDKRSFRNKLPPFVLQLLIENAIKHNVVAASRPLLVRIESTEETLTVSNNIQAKISVEKGEGAGLENIIKRYALLTTQPVIISTDNNKFTVTLPLL